jgi:N-acetylmuramoyl-L-alanine amidase
MSRIFTSSGHKTVKAMATLLWLTLLYSAPWCLANATAIESIRLWPAPENSRVVFDLSAQPDFSYFKLSSPERLVIDFQQSKNVVPLAELANSDPRIKKIRTSKAKAKNSVRIVLDLAGKYTHSVFALAPAGQYGHRLVVDLYDQARQKVVVSENTDKKRDIVIAIDAGHGGEDPGSIGAKGNYEKRVTLAIAKKLEALINQEQGMKAIMTRSGDYYIPVGNRSDIARDKKVDFLVSIHADAFYTPQPNGASVWVVSNKRVESEMEKWLINREKNSELLGGGGGVIKHTQDDNLAKTLADMNKDHSLEVSIGVASSVINQLRRITKMHKRIPQHGNLGVLKASDFPSILVETGFISNHSEEQKLISSQHQQHLASAIFQGIRHHFLDYPPKDTLFASIGHKNHKVAKGESLSVLAQRYKVSINELKLLNNLSSGTVLIGQTLKIPRAD